MFANSSYIELIKINNSMKIIKKNRFYDRYIVEYLIWRRGSPRARLRDRSSRSRLGSFCCVSRDKLAAPSAVESTITGHKRTKKIIRQLIRAKPRRSSIIRGFTIQRVRIAMDINRSDFRQVLLRE